MLITFQARRPENSLDVVVFSHPNYFSFITEKTILFQGSRGGPTFSGLGGGSGPPTHPPSGSAHENLHDVLISDLRCRACRPSDVNYSGVHTCIAHLRILVENKFVEQ